MSLNATPPAAVRAAHRVEAPKGGKAMNRAHILVVDDEADLLELVQYNLAAAGYDVTCVGSDEETLAAVGSVRPDLVILDVLLPGMDGPGCLQGAERRRANIRHSDCHADGAG